ncbi:MAG: CDP-diacylglycerol--glycerol-3-phosphate 3-phosphatidyltransferase [Eubacteriales bacterium]|nr:CDP-diacylglycerol--glycerol-3-phosphate 3-phosphatidyltransferase [Eubacteriales bacterium]
MNLPNKLTILRIIAVPFFIAAYMYHWYIAAFVLFVAASLTDMLDGKIARARNLVTNFGKIMDPLADKILVYSALCLFVENGTIPAWSLIIILAREFAIAGMRTVAASEGTVIAAGMSGKIKTVLQMFAVIILIVAAGPLPQLQTIGMLVFWASLIMTVYSGVEYIAKNKSVFSM